MASAAVLYTPEVLGLATSLARWPWDAQLDFQGEARSSTCGSTVAVGLSLGLDGRIERVGLRVHACAIGQAAAAIFAGAVYGLDRAALKIAEQSILRWLNDNALPANWPQLTLIAEARNYPARHGAILLPWKAALAVLPTG